MKKKAKSSLWRICVVLGAMAVLLPWAASAQSIDDITLVNANTAGTSSKSALRSQLGATTGTAGSTSRVAAAPAVSSFTVVNADTDADIVTVNSQATVSLDTSPRINVRANASAAVSVIFTQGSTTRTENSAPFALAGDSKGNYAAWAPAPGVYTISATPFSSTSGQGTSGPAAVLTLTVVASQSSNLYQYEVITGHDGHQDPDDNIAMLAGFIAIKRAQESSGSRVKHVGMIYGDTSEANQDGMIPGGPGSGDDAGDLRATANYEFYKLYGRPALESMGFGTFFDVVPENYNFNASSLPDMTSGGEFIAQRVRDAIGKKIRVVYSAGGGENTAAEAVAWLRNQGYSDTQIKEHFAVVQHSVPSNWGKFTETAAKNIIGGFTINIENQNPYSGLGLPPRTVSASRTSTLLAANWAVAAGDTPSGIPNLTFRLDASDGGSHHFASNTAVIETNWTRRGVPGSVTAISYKVYNASLMNSQLN
ncbi:MAG: hypothetical protein ACRCYU_10370 [Nocardioides sp.]